MRSSALYLGLAAAMMASAQPKPGRWDGTVRIGDLQVPFTMNLEVSGSKATGVFLNGDESTASTGGSFEGDTLRLDFDQISTRLEATLADEGINGTYGGGKVGPFKIDAAPFCTCGFVGEAGPDISGAWELSGGESRRMTIRRKGEDTLVTVDGVKGMLAGRFDGLSFNLRHFDGVRAMVVDMEPQKDGAMLVVWKEPGSSKKMRAARVPAKL